MLCCLVIYMGGYHLVYALYQAGVKNEMRHYLQNHTDDRYGTYFSFRLSQAKVNDPYFQWEEENQEFRYQGEFYDIVTIHRNGDSLHICALKDGRENELEKQLQDIYKSNTNNKPQSAALAIKFFSVFCYSAGTPTFLLTSKAVNHTNRPDEKLLSEQSDNHTPPPRHVFLNSNPA